jgi:hypothetical protein
MNSSLYAFCQFVGLKKKIKHEGVFKLTPPHTKKSRLVMFVLKPNLFKTSENVYNKFNSVAYQQSYKIIN